MKFFRFKKLSRGKKILFSIIGIILLSSIGYMSFTYYGNFSVGKRSGKIIKLSKKGYVFKTWEGLLNTGLQNEPFAFSVDDSQKEVIKDLEEAAKNDEHVTLHYEQKFVKYAWRGDTDYFIVSVERASK